MKTPSRKVLKDVCTFVKRKIFNPIAKNCNQTAIFGLFEKFANYFFSKINDTTTMMLKFDALSLLTSSAAQIVSLKKSDRENKDYLIKQEIYEFLVSIPLTIGLPYVATQTLGRQLESGKIMTASTKELIDEVIKQYLGVQGKEGFYIPPRIPIREQIDITKNNFLQGLQKSKIVPKKIKNKIKIKDINQNRSVPLAGLKDLLWDFDQKIYDEIQERKLSGIEDIDFFKSPEIARILNKNGGFRNKSAYSHIFGEIEGIKIATLLGLSIIAGNVIMPIIKNKLTNYMYKKELLAKGETPESIKRKKRYGNLTTDKKIHNQNNIFNVFSNEDNTITQKPLEITTNQDRYKNLLKPPKENNAFKDIQTFSSLTTQSSRLRI